MKLIPVGKHHFAQVDDEDYKELSRHKWRYHQGYAHTSISVTMPRMIMKTPRGLVTDHINGQRLDNRKANLRICTQKQNLCNTAKRLGKSSIYKGVHYDKGKRLWRASIRVNGVVKELGRFKEERHAGMFYDIWAKEVHGEFARLNFISAVPSLHQ